MDDRERRGAQQADAVIGMDRVVETSLQAVPSGASAVLAALGGAGEGDGPAGGEARISNAHPIRPVPGVASEEAASPPSSQSTHGPETHAAASVEAKDAPRTADGQPAAVPLSPGAHDGTAPGGFLVHPQASEAPAAEHAPNAALPAASSENPAHEARDEGTAEAAPSQSAFEPLQQIKPPVHAEPFHPVVREESHAATGGTPAPAPAEPAAVAANAAPVVGTLALTGSEGDTLSGALSASDADGDALAFSIGGAAAHGTAGVASDGTVTYAPDAGWNGTDAFTVSVSDGHDTVARAVSVSIAPVAQAPAIVSAGVHGSEDAASISFPLAISSDDALSSITITGLPVGATLSAGTLSGGVWHLVEADLAGLTVSLPALWHGTASLTVAATAEDGAAHATATATVSLTVDHINHAPTVASASLTGQEGDVLTGAFGASDADGDALSYSVSSNASHGTASVAADGSFSFTPDAGWNGSDSFTLTASDGAGGSVSKTVSLSLSPTAEAPSIIADAVSASEDGPVVLDIAIASQDALSSITVTGLPVGATLSAGTLSGGAWHLVAADLVGLQAVLPADWNGSFDLTVAATAQDGAAQASSSATETVTIASVNDAPTATGSSVSGLVNATISGSVSGADVDGDALTFSAGTGPSHGTVSVGADGSFVYSPTTGFSGSDAFTVSVSDGHGGNSSASVSVTVSPAASPSQSSIPDLGSASHGSAPISIPAASILAGTSDPSGYALTLASASADHGTVAIQGDGSVLFTPDPSFDGTATLSFVVSNGHGGQASLDATVTMTNAGPVLSGSGASVFSGHSVSGSVSGTDADGDALSFSLGTGPSHGTVTVAADGSYAYSADAGWSGTDVFQVQGADGHGGTASRSVSVAVAADTLTTGTTGGSGNEDSTVSGTVSASDGAGDALSWSLVSAHSTAGGIQTASTAHGTVHLVEATGAYTFEPASGWSGSDSFDVAVSDGHGSTASQTVSISVAAVNLAPAITGHTDGTGYIGHAMTGTVSASDGDGDALAYSISSGPANGSASIASNGAWTYTPSAAGTDAFTVTVSDGQGGTTTQTITTVATDYSISIDGSSVAWTSDTMPFSSYTPNFAASPYVSDKLVLKELSDALPGGDWGQSYVALDAGYSSDPNTARVIIDFRLAWGQLGTVHFEGQLTDASKIIGGVVQQDMDLTLHNTVSYPNSGGSIVPWNDDGITVTIKAGTDLYAARAATPYPVGWNGGYQHLEMSATPSMHLPETLPEHNRVLWSGQTIGGDMDVADPAGGAYSWSVDSGPSHGSFTLTQDGGWSYTADSAYMGVDTVVVRVSDALGHSDTQSLNLYALPSHPAPSMVDAGYAADRLVVKSSTIAFPDGIAWSSSWVHLFASDNSTISMEFDARFGVWAAKFTGSVSDASRIVGGVAQEDIDITLSWSNIDIGGGTYGYQPGTITFTVERGTNAWQAVSYATHPEWDGWTQLGAMNVSGGDALIDATQGLAYRIANGGSQTGTANGDHFEAAGATATATGGAGADSFVLHAGSAMTVQDFSFAQNDELLLHGFVSSQLSLTEQAGDVHVAADGVDLAVLAHVTLADFGGATTGADAHAWADSHGIFHYG